jgi:hypothetical protein
MRLYGIYPDGRGIYLDPFFITVFATNNGYGLLLSSDMCDACFPKAFSSLQEANDYLCMSVKEGFIDASQLGSVITMQSLAGLRSFVTEEEFSRVIRSLQMKSEDYNGDESVRSGSDLKHSNLKQRPIQLIRNASEKDDRE